MRITPCALGLVLATAAAAPAFADDFGVDMPSIERGHRPPPTWTLDSGMTVRWLGSTSAASLSSESSTMIGPEVTLGRHLTRLGGLDLGGFARVLGGDTSGMIFQTLHTELHQIAVVGGVGLQRVVWRRIAVTAALELGAARTAAVVGDDLGEMAPVDDHAWGMVGGASIGTQIKLFRTRRFYLGAGVDLGYLVTQPVKLRAYPRSRPEDALSIPTTYASLGHLDTRGVTLAFSIRGGGW